MMFVSFLACFGYKQQLTALDLQVQLQAEQITEQQRSIDSLEKKLEHQKDPTATEKNEEAAQMLLKEVQNIILENNNIVPAESIAIVQQKLEVIGGQYSGTKTARRAAKIQKELSVVGLDAPNEWGIEESLLGYWNYDSNTVTVVVFWEEWCPHCKREIPQLEKTYRAYQGKGLQVVGFTKLTRNSSKEKVMTLLNESEVSYPVVKENGEASTYFNVSGIPAAAILKDGRIVWRGHPASINDGMLDQLLY